MTTDLTFITNEQEKSLKDRFRILIKDAKYFDSLVGYFFVSGFYKIYKELENSEKIRILIGIGTNLSTFRLINNNCTNQVVEPSHKETKEIIEENIQKEFEDSQDNYNVEEGTIKFIEWIKNNKLEIRAYPSQNIHAKLYIVTFKEGDRDIGRVITGSSNFTQAGLEDNLEFNVELKNRADYEFAKQKFEELWKNAVDVSEKYISTIENKTWINQDISPYHLYLKFLYEYFKDELNQTGEIFLKYYPEDFKKLIYQEQAVLNAKKILEEYGGVFLSDVVGLGKTYIATLLAGQLDGRTLVIAPPTLLNKDNLGSWPNAFSDFKIPAEFESIGKLDDIIKRGTERYKNIIIDEAHRFRTETNITYDNLSKICRGKRVILVTATPYNNHPNDILSLIKLFQNSHKSTIPILLDLERFFGDLEKKLKNLDRKKDYNKYISVVIENAKQIREKVLKYLMVRRTRSEIEKYFANDLKSQNIKFPRVEPPKPLYYKLNKDEERIFDQTIELISQKFTYSRYMPLLYLTKPINQLKEQSQKNMGKFMKILLVKRLESSFYAFRNTIERFVNSYEMFIKAYKKGKLYVSKKYANKIFDLLGNDDDEQIQRLIDEGKAEGYSALDFKKDFLNELEKDLEVLKKIKSMWEDIKRDPKLDTLLFELKNNNILKQNKIIVFTESKETAEYLAENINKEYNNIALCFTGSSSEFLRDKVIENFDVKAKNEKNDYRILISTDVLSEGVNLHRSNVVVNYDIPWNPTRMMQRVGRINRIDTTFDVIYTFNFFPTEQSNDQIKLKESAITKINAFLTLLGGDAALLTEGEPVGSHELFNRLISQKTLTGEDEEEKSELKYLQVIKEVREKNPQLFNKIKCLPKKARSVKIAIDNNIKDSLLTYFRKGKLNKFFISNSNNQTKEIDFVTAAEIMECDENSKRKKLPETYFKLLDKNKEAFDSATNQEITETIKQKGKDNTLELLKIIKATFNNTQQLTEDQENYIKELKNRLYDGAVPKHTIKQVLEDLKSLNSEIQNPLKVIGVLQTVISSQFLKSHYAEQRNDELEKKEVILSMYLSGE
jgi:superfamily II DNA/RNA helicase